MKDISFEQLRFEPQGLTVTDTPKSLGVSRKTLSAVLNGRVWGRPEVAVRRARIRRYHLETLELFVSQ